MRIAVASGKGGTGKTTIAVNLAVVLRELGHDTLYADCDVEEPNGHIFLRPSVDSSVPVSLPYPVVDEDACIACGKCAEICRYKAIIMLNDKPLVMPDMCHACGGCVLVCPVDVITEKGRDIGVIEQGERDGLRFAQGTLDIGQVLSPPVIRAVKRTFPPDGTVVVDCPPGTSCPVITAIGGSDYVVLVTEPTPFGLHDLKLAAEAVRALGIPCGVVINKCDAGDGDTIAYCRSRGLPVLCEIPEDEAVARAYSRGEILVGTLPWYRETIEGMADRLMREMSSRPSRSM